MIESLDRLTLIENHIIHEPEFDFRSRGRIRLCPISAEETLAIFYRNALNTVEGREFMWEGTPRDLDGITEFLMDFKADPTSYTFIVDFIHPLPEDMWMDDKFSMPMSSGVGPTKLVTTETIFIGHIRLRSDPTTDVCWLSYYNANLSRRGQGLMKRAVALFLMIIPTEVDIRARVSRENTASIAILDSTMTMYRYDKAYFYYQRIN